MGRLSPSVISTGAVLSGALRTLVCGMLAASLPAASCMSRGSLLSVGAVYATVTVSPPITARATIPLAVFVVPPPLAAGDGIAPAIANHREGRPAWLVPVALVQQVVFAVVERQSVAVDPGVVIAGGDQLRGGLVLSA